jgi:hypothetical protein
MEGNKTKVQPAALENPEKISTNRTFVPRNINRRKEPEQRQINHQKKGWLSALVDGVASCS